MMKPDPKLIRFTLDLLNKLPIDLITLFFVALFFLDGILSFLPADGILGIALLFRPKQFRPWFLAAIAGSLGGFLTLQIVSQSSFQMDLIGWIQASGANVAFDEILKHAAKYGYLDLSIAVLTFVPPGISLVAAIIVGLNPALAFVIVSLSKIFRILIIIYLIRKMKKGVMAIKRKIQKRKESS